MARPQKYKTEAERLQARREQFRKANKNRNNNNNNNSVSNNNKNNNNYSKNYKLLYELLKIEQKELETKYKALLYENRVTNEYCKELEEQLNEAKEMGY